MQAAKKHVAGAGYDGFLVGVAVEEWYTLSVNDRIEDSD